VRRNLVNVKVDVKIDLSQGVGGEREGVGGGVITSADGVCWVGGGSKHSLTKENQRGGKRGEGTLFFRLNRGSAGKKRTSRTGLGEL